MKSALLKGVETRYVVLLWFWFGAKLPEKIQKDRVVDLLDGILGQDLQAVSYPVALVQAGNIGSNNKPFVVFVFDFVEFDKGVGYNLEWLDLFVVLVVEVPPEEEVELCLLREFLG